MKSKTEAFLLRSISFDEKYLDKLNIFLREKFFKVLYQLETNERSSNKIVFEELPIFIKKIKNEKIENVKVYAYKNENQSEYDEDLSISFRESKMLPTVLYRYEDNHTDSDVVFLLELRAFLKENQTDYHFLYDDGLIPAEGKNAFLLFVQLVFAVVLAYLYFHFIEKSFAYNSWLSLYAIACCFFVINFLFRYFFPRLVFILTDKEKTKRSRYDLVKKILLWLLNNIFFIFLGIIIERYFLT